jgi:hypothetical protein
MDNASQRATVICRGIALWGEFQNTTARDLAFVTRYDAWLQFCQINCLTDEAIDYIKSAQYEAMTWAINH